MTTVSFFKSVEHINDGDILQASVDSVEGHRRVTLKVIKRKCPSCLNGWRRDIVTGIDEDGNEISQDMECSRCNTTGFIGTGEME